MGVGVGTRFHTGGWDKNGGRYGTIVTLNEDDLAYTASYDVHMDGETTVKTVSAKQVEGDVEYARRRARPQGIGGGGGKESKQTGDGPSGGKRKGRDDHGPETSLGLDESAKGRVNKKTQGDSKREEGSGKRGGGDSHGQKRKRGSAEDGNQTKGGVGTGTGRGGGEPDRKREPTEDPIGEDEPKLDQVIHVSTSHSPFSGIDTV